VRLKVYNLRDEAEMSGLLLNGSKAGSDIIQYRQIIFWIEFS
jgi:hypothetical protein